MKIPSKTVCDICRKECGKKFGRNNKVYKIKHKTMFGGSAGCITERGHIDLCENCMIKFRIWFKKNS